MGAARMLQGNIILLPKMPLEQRISGADGICSEGKRSVLLGGNEW